MTAPAPKRARKAAPKKRRKAVGKTVEKPKAPTRKKATSPVVPPDKAKPLPATELATQNKAVEESVVSVDWVSVKHRYVCGFLPEGAPSSTPVKWESLVDLSAALGLVLRTVERHSSDEDWPEARLAFQSKLGLRMKDETTKLLSVRQARARETIHAGAQFLVQKVIEKAQREQVSMSDLVGGITGLHRALKATTEAADPDIGKVVLPGGGGGRWLLIREGLDPVEDADVMDVLPEEDPVE